MKMNKKALKVSGLVLTGALVFGSGFFGKEIVTKATTDWKTDAVNTANSDLGAAGYQKKNALIDSASTDINSKVQQDIGTEVDQQKADLEKLLDQYYQMKLDGLENTQAYKDLEAQIAAIKQSVYDRYTKEIDQVFAAQTTTTN
jgi:peptidoglycan hydrolase CwlO-like protein